MNDETFQNLLTEEEIRQQMSQITRRYQSEREELRKTHEDLAKKEARAYLAVTFLEDHLLTNANAKAYLKKAKEAGTKLIKEDKLAIQQLEIETEQIAYDLAKFNADTSDKQFAKLESQLSYFQTLMKFAGKPVPLAESAF